MPIAVGGGFLSQKAAQNKAQSFAEARRLKLFVDLPMTKCALDTGDYGMERFDETFSKKIFSKPSFPFAKRISVCDCKIPIRVYRKQ
jgi:hypothetical protein